MQLFVLLENINQVKYRHLCSLGLTFPVTSCHLGRLSCVASTWSPVPAILKQNSSLCDFLAQHFCFRCELVSEFHFRCFVNIFDTKKKNGAHVVFFFFLFLASHSDVGTRVHEPDFHAKIFIYCLHRQPP